MARTRLARLVRASVWGRRTGATAAVAHTTDPDLDRAIWLGETDADELVLGTARYMSPEQAGGPRVELDARSDVFSLGAVVYEILTRQPPHPGGNSPVTLMAAQACQVPSLSEVIGPGKVPHALERIASRALAADRDGRYATVEAFRSDLVQFMRRDGEFPRLTVEAGGLIIREGDEGDAVYIIERGSCEVFRTVDGARVALRTMGVGEVFGEAAILTDGPRTRASRRGSRPPCW